ncbi:hypothetical protein KIW84_034488 [Lathyrus oleraceus]|uniref:IPO4/5-like TPR repeats domain-containing protein n=1 Tax=Pisum sativum TaxID=3888 RepID=A0A9D5B184_PEA|nr:hypothetical protein KIW84_034488 [Pisum sativum]
MTEYGSNGRTVPSFFPWLDYAAKYPLSEFFKARPPLWNTALQSGSFDDDEFEHFEDVIKETDKEPATVLDKSDEPVTASDKKGNLGSQRIKPNTELSLVAKEGLGLSIGGDVSKQIVQDTLKQESPVVSGSTSLSLGIKEHLFTSVTSPKINKINPDLDKGEPVSLELSLSKEECSTHSSNIDAKSDSDTTRVNSRVNWDLNTTMDAWDEGSDTSSVKTSIDGLNITHRKEPNKGVNPVEAVDVANGHLVCGHGNISSCNNNAPTPHQEARAMSAILLRKQLTRDDSFLWPHLSPQTHSSLKSLLLSSIQTENSKSISKKLCDTISELASVHRVCPGSAERDRFQDLLPAMMTTLTETLNSGQEATAQEALESLIELARTEPRFLRRQIVDVVGAMLQIADAESLKEGTRHLAIEFVITLTEAREHAPGMMRNMPQFISRLIAILMKMLLDIEDDPAWHTAETEDEDADETSNCSVEQERLDRLSISLGGNTIVPVASEQLHTYLAAAEWQNCHVASIALAQIAEGCSKVTVKKFGASGGYGMELVSR